MAILGIVLWIVMALAPFLMIGAAIYYEVGWLFYSGFLLFCLCGWQHNNFARDGETAPGAIILGGMLGLLLMLIGFIIFILE